MTYIKEGFHLAWQIIKIKCPLGKPTYFRCRIFYSVFEKCQLIVVTNNQLIYKKYLLPECQIFRRKNLFLMFIMQEYKFLMMTSTSTRKNIEQSRKL